MTKVSNLNLYGSSVDETKRLHLLADTTTQIIKATGTITFQNMSADGITVVKEITDVVGAISTAAASNATNLSTTNSLSTALSTGLSTEASVRTSADSSLTLRLSIEEDAKNSAIVEAGEDISSLTTRLSDEEGVRSSAITAEENARTSADSSLTTRLADVSTSVSVVLFNADANYDTLAEIANAFEQADTGVLDTITSLGVKLDALSTTLSTLTE